MVEVDAGEGPPGITGDLVAREHQVRVFGVEREPQMVAHKLTHAVFISPDKLVRNIMGIPRSKALFYWESRRPDSSKPDSETNTGMRLRKSESYHGGVGDGDQLR